VNGFGLLIGHLVGDYIFQNDWMAANKVNPLCRNAVYDPNSKTTAFRIEMKGAFSLHRPLPSVHVRRRPLFVLVDAVVGLSGDVRPPLANRPLPFGSAVDGPCERSKGIRYRPALAVEHYHRG
jgi:hypothetical protein